MATLTRHNQLYSCKLLNFYFIYYQQGLDVKLNKHYIMIHMNLEASVDEWFSLTKTVNHWLARFLLRMKLSCSNKFVKFRLFIPGAHSYHLKYTMTMY
jgi:hypothetical protein